MAILINFFDNVILQAISEEIVPKVSFFKDRYFPTGLSLIHISEPTRR